MTETAGSARELQSRLSAELNPADRTAASVELPHVEDAAEAGKPADLSRLDELAFKDVERRAEGLVQLILHNDRKGMQFVGTYCAVAGVICGVVMVHKDALNVIALGASAIAIVSLTIGMLYALAAQWTVEMYPTGRLPDFWVWSRRYEIAPSAVIDKHLESTMQAIDHNEKLNTKSSLRLKRAYICGAIAFGTVGAAMAAYVATAIACRPKWDWAWVAPLLEPLCRP